VKRHIAAMIAALVAAACGDNLEPEDAGQETPLAGSLVQVTLDSQVGVLLDDLPVGSRERIAEALAAMPEDWWTERAMRQVRLTALRLIYRELYYEPEEMRRSLPLPPESVLSIEVGAPERASVDGHDLLVVDYTMSGILVSDEESPGLAEPELAEVGGVWDEDFLFPIDPTLLLQRTGYACMDEDQFPAESVDEINASQYYDDYCEVESPEEPGCHYTDYPDETCAEAVARVIGGVEGTVHFERLAWDESLAATARTGDVTVEGAPDLRVLTEGPESLSNNRIVYKYVPPGHCALAEECVGGPGWRRLLAFDSIDHNVGSAPLFIGPVDYSVEGLGGELIDNNVYTLSECHQHFHFQHYGDFSFSAEGTAAVQKNGFCLESTGRLSNHEGSPLHHPYSCWNQGVAPGWVDLYAAGLTCNWIDLTGVDSAGGIEGTLEFRSNPDGFLCEGTLVTDDAGDQMWEPTDFETEDGDPVNRPVCDEAAGTDGNDVGAIAIEVPAVGGLMSSPCGDAQELGALRNCDFTPAPAIACTPGAEVTLSCTGGDVEHPQAVRVCETSAVLGSGVDCFYRDALATAVADGGAPVDVTFTCPEERDDDEPGGEFQVYLAPLFAPDGPVDVTCAVD
jgi:hypothetical protein